MPLSPLFQFSRHRRTSSFVVPGSRPMNVYGIVVVGRVVLGREVVRLGLAAAADARGVLVALVQVMRDRPHVVEELAEQVPALLPRHHRRAPSSRSPACSTAVLQQEARPPLQPDVAEAFVGGRAGAVVGVGGRREPALVDAAAMRAEGVEIVGVQPEAAARVHERAGNPAGFEAEQSAARRRMAS